MTSEHEDWILELVREVLLFEHTHPVVREYFLGYLMTGHAPPLNTAATPRLTMEQGGTLRTKLYEATHAAISARDRNTRILAFDTALKKYTDRRTKAYENDMHNRRKRH